MYFGAAYRRACGRAFVRMRARVRPRGAASALGYNRRSERAGVPITRMRVCACLRGDFPWLRPVRPHVGPLSRGGRGPHACAVRGRWISSTKVKALPEWLGRCKDLEELCVLRPPPAVRVCGGAGAALLPRALRRRALGRRRAALDAAAAALPVVGRAGAPRAHGWRLRLSRARWGWAGAARRGRTVGVQGGVQHRARGAAGGGRLAEPEETVSAPDRRAPTARPSATCVAGVRAH
jgi:hypothetical protein